MGLLSNYCGFGGSGIPQHTVDEICAEHDRDYGIIQQKGENPYLKFNWADQKMLKALEQHTAKGVRETILKKAATALWTLKRSFANSPDSTQADITAKLRGSKRPAEIELDPEGKVKQRKSGMTLRKRIPVDDDEEMDTPPTEATVAAKSSSSSGQHGYKETSIIPQQPHYGLPEVLTITCPWTFYCSGGLNTAGGPTPRELSFRTTSLTDIFMGTVAHPTAGGAIGGNLYDSVVGGSLNFSSPLVEFPSRPVDKSTEHPQWAQYFGRLYQAYSILKCDWEMTIHNPRNRVNADLIVGWLEEAYIGTSSSGNVAPSAPLIQAENWPGIKFRIVHSTADGSEKDNWQVIKGTYYPGQANKNVRNDEAVQTWTTYTDPTAFATPSLTELLHFMVWKAPFNDAQENAGFNIRMHMRFTVQFRDLVAAARYPTSGQTDVVQTLPGDAFSLI